MSAACRKRPHGRGSLRRGMASRLSRKESLAGTSWRPCSTSWKIGPHVTNWRRRSAESLRPNRPFISSIQTDVSTSINGPLAAVTKMRAGAYEGDGPRACLIDCLPRGLCRRSRRGAEFFACAVLPAVRDSRCLNTSWFGAPAWQFQAKAHPTQDLCASCV